MGYGVGLPRILDNEDSLQQAYGDFLIKVLVYGEVTSELLRNNLSVNLDDDLFIVAHRTNHPTPSHTHEFYELAYVLKGSVINCFDDREIRLLEGSVCIMNLQSTHALKVSDPEGILVNVCLRKSFFDDGILGRFLDQDSPLPRFLGGRDERNLLILSDPRNRELAEIMQAMLARYEQDGFHQSLGTTGLALALLDCLSRIDTYSYLGIDEKTLKMIEYVETHLESVSVHELSREFGYNESYVSQYVRRHTGRTVTEIVTDARMEKARRLLQETTDPIDQIARRIGYESPSHFSLVFKRHNGMTPGTYRHQ